jgi:hypothetical protein
MTCSEYLSPAFLLTCVKIPEGVLYVGHCITYSPQAWNRWTLSEFVRHVRKQADMHVDQEPRPGKERSKRISGNSCPLPSLHQHHPDGASTDPSHTKMALQEEKPFWTMLPQFYAPFSLALIQSAAKNVHEHIRMGHPIREADDCSICMI